MNIGLRKSKISGKGVFAARDFKEGEVVMIWDLSLKVHFDRIKELSEDDKNHLNYTGNGVYVVMKSPEKFVNHSCDPNTYVDHEKDIALRDIKKGEEITTDYSLNSLSEWKMKCNCKSKNCRKIVFGDFRKLDARTKKKYEPYLQKWLKKEIEKN
ncbi:SET domain-containing protein-lysine N-methyltransferase [Candidatus Woesearchaeota archaeon]|nr:SET domain-containing protein-lysine N-methyltransferase [Candidatus Woesearchaeota archaeon]